jgi:hypothetical protein
LTDLRDDPELRYENNFIRNDLFLAATSVQKILDLINKEAELVENFVAEARDTVESAFQCYVSDLEKARSLAHDKLKVPKLIFYRNREGTRRSQGCKEAIFRGVRQKIERASYLALFSYLDLQHGLLLIHSSG